MKITITIEVAEEELQKHLQECGLTREQFIAMGKRAWEEEVMDDLPVKATASVEFSN